MNAFSCIRRGFDRFPSLASLAGIVLFFILGFASVGYAETYEQTYYADGADHFMNVYLQSGGTHSFFVNGVPYGEYNYVAYRDTGSGYTQIWSSSTSIGWDPTFSSYVSPGYKVKLVIYDGSWNVKSVYYWYIYAAPMPDLIVQDISISPTSPNAGESVTITATLKNQGNGDCERFYLKYYIDGSYIGEDDCYYGLDAGQSNTETISYTVTSSGNHTVRVFVDSNYDISESNEGNNYREETYYWNPPPMPDLIAYGVSVNDTTVEPGQSVTVNWTAKNQGTGSAESTQQGVMWSTNNTISRSEDTLMDREYLGPMSVNAISPEANTVSIPVSATPGQTYYIGIYEDYDLDEGESDEENNGSSAVAVTINQPDQTVTILDAWIKSESWVDIDEDGYASVLTLEWDAKVNYGTMSVYANIRADSFDALERDLGNTSSYTLGINATRQSFVVPVDAKDLNHNTWDFQIDLYKAGTSILSARLSMGADPKLNDVMIELSSEEAGNTGPGPDYGNTTAQEYGDALYVLFEPIESYYNYNHAGLLAGIDGEGTIRTFESSGDNFPEDPNDDPVDGPQEGNFQQRFKDAGIDYYGAFIPSTYSVTLPFDDRKKVVSKAREVVDGVISYPEWSYYLLNLPIAIETQAGWTAPIDVAEIQGIRCDGLVEYAYEAVGIRVWLNCTEPSTEWNIAYYPDHHNEEMDTSLDPHYELSPWAQRGAPLATGPDFFGTYEGPWPDTTMTKPSPINLPTIQFTLLSVTSTYADIEIQATDESGIFKILGEVYQGGVWTNLVDQKNPDRHPISDSYTVQVRVTGQPGSSLEIHAKAQDHGGNWSDSGIGDGWYTTIITLELPEISVTPLNIDFGTVEVGFSTYESFIVENTGSGTLEGNASVSLPFTIFSGGSYSLAQGQTQEVIVRFSPTEEGSFNNNVIFTGGDGATRPVSGEGTVPDIDSDNDGLLDALENTTCTDPNDADTDNDGMPDGVEDADHNGVVDTGETGPCLADTDGDGIQDGTELGYTLADIGPDTDTNVFIPDQDPGTTSDPLNSDTDGDGLSDGQEDTNHNGMFDPGELDPNHVQGDVDGDGDVDLEDSILALQVMAGIEPSATVYKEADVNGDGKIGLEEVIYILQKVSGE